MTASVNLQPIHDLIVQHPVASVFTVAVCLVVIAAGLLFCTSVRINNYYSSPVPFFTFLDYRSIFSRSGMSSLAFPFVYRPM